MRTTSRSVPWSGLPVELGGVDCPLAPDAARVQRLAGRDDVEVRWLDLEHDAVRFAKVAPERLIAPGVVLVVTLRRDGTPRLTPVEPLDGDLWLSMMWRSQKAVDLARDDRVLVHSVVADRDNPGGEVKLRGRAIAIDDPAHRYRYSDAVSVLGWRPEEPYFHLFRIDIDNVTFIRYDSETGDQYVARP